MIDGKDPYERAAADRPLLLGGKGRPSKNVVVASGEQAEYAMPAAAWAARSGDAVLLDARRTLCRAPTRKALREHEKPNIYVLGPEKVISPEVADAARQARQGDAASRARRPVENAIAFARYEQGGFGWGVTVPGYNFTLANTDAPARRRGRGGARPRTACSRRCCSPTDAEPLPRALESYFLTCSPASRTTPARPSTTACGSSATTRRSRCDQQARLDQITELMPVQAGAP